MSLGLSYPVYSHAIQSGVYRLFTTIVYLAIQIACFDAIFDCIMIMFGPLFNLHIVKSTPNNQTWKRQGFWIFILTVTSHFTFSSCSVKCSVKMTFSYFITCYKYSIGYFQEISPSRLLNTQKIYFCLLRFFIP